MASSLQHLFYHNSELSQSKEPDRHRHSVLTKALVERILSKACPESHRRVEGFMVSSLKTE
jgi:hypothetical protein